MTCKARAALKLAYEDIRHESDCASYCGEDCDCIVANLKVALEADDCIPREVAEQLAERLSSASRTVHRRYCTKDMAIWTRCDSPICKTDRAAIAALDKALRIDRQELCMECDSK